MERRREFSIWYVLLAVMVLLSYQRYFGGHTETLAYSDFKTLLAAGKLKDLTISETTINGEVLAGGLTEILGDRATRLPRADPTATHRFTTVRVEDPKLTEDLGKAGVRFSGRAENRWLGSLLSTVLWIAVFFGVWSFAMRRMQGAGGMMAVGKSKAKVYVETDTKVRFDDVAGVDEAKEELQEIVNFLGNPREYGRLGARIPKGVLLVGPPGTGKTLLARAVAGEAGVPFFSISGSEFVEMFVGVGAARVRDLFDQARKQAPAIIFVDELDALGRARGIHPGLGGHDEKEQTLNQLLVEMDGFDPGRGLVLLAATNRPEILDPALLRAGRFDRQVLVDRPDKPGRLAILKVHVTGVILAPDVDIAAVAAMTPGFTGADLANLVNEAALLATRRGGDAVSLEDFTQAIERIVAGLEKKNRLLNSREREIVAHHEMGHALVALSLPGVDPVQKVSIIPRGIGALGYTIQRPIEDRFLMTREELVDKMTVLLGGRAAEDLVFGHLSTGAADDLAKATDIARSMVMLYGMDEALGHAVYQRPGPAFMTSDLPYDAPARSDDTERQIDHAVRALLQQAFEQARELLSQRRSELDTGARKLLEQETLSEPEIAAIAGKVQGPAPEVESQPQAVDPRRPTRAEP